MGILQEPTVGENSHLPVTEAQIIPLNEVARLVHEAALAVVRKKTAIVVAHRSARRVHELSALLVGKGLPEWVVLFSRRGEENKWKGRGGQENRVRGREWLVRQRARAPRGHARGSKRAKKMGWGMGEGENGELANKCAPRG